MNDQSGADQRPTVLLVHGGASSEHGVSCLTAASVLKAIDHDRYQVIPLGITRSGNWVLVPIEEVIAMAVTEGQLPEVGGDHPEAVILPGGRLFAMTEGTARPVATIDVAFPLLHGPFGEDGTIQGMFEMLGIRYVGSGVAASANGMDKILMKTNFAQRGIPQGDWQPVTAQEWDHEPDQVRGRLAHLTFPLFVKPARAGSSVGISRITSLDELPAAIETARAHDPRMVVEAGLVGAREVECAVLADPSGGRPRASLVGEVRMLTDGFYDFQAKYLPSEGQVALDIPATIDPDVQQLVQQVAIDTFIAMDAEGLARVDTFVTEQGQVLVNEINTLPGFTPLSMYPQLWQATGVDYTTLVEDLIQLALARPLGLR